MTTKRVRLINGVAVISLWQPWAQAIVTPHPTIPNRGIKQWETRGWRIPPRYIGKRVLIHAAKRFELWQRELMCQSPWALHRDLFRQDKMKFGCIIGSVRIVEDVASVDFVNSAVNGRKLYSDTANEEIHFGDWTDGRYGWKLADPILFDAPITEIGRQKFWTVSIDRVPEAYRDDFKHSLLS